MKEVVKALGELDKAAEERYEEREQKRMRLFMEVEEARRRAYAEEEEKRRQAERLHEERMQYMFLSFLHHNLPATGTEGMASCAGPSYNRQPTYGMPHGPPFSTSQSAFSTANFPRAAEELPYTAEPFPYDDQSTSRSP